MCVSVTLGLPRKRFTDARASQHTTSVQGSTEPSHRASEVIISRHASLFGALAQVIWRCVVVEQHVVDAPPEEPVSESLLVGLALDSERTLPVRHAVQQARGCEYAVLPPLRPGQDKLRQAG
eukprot:CAMPEP_0181173468 /NCGR_PEP_ID=MMETSP1096-20121128/3017_1 /TAXON_ID=156174 ORGANISM="Chrysochromulina ericina, Strain CCMP281" /NCGR_SAMPLE_ID=MMETSP1096 /ASSEMBLY_ACC=CAM_ASM_000453 /LENGTH=121 /DNA_ID=CAMNT_0023261301 /DNA_START=194 /DNA_END=559 /DNA_ORIENTATION=-